MLRVCRRKQVGKKEENESLVSWVGIRMKLISISEILSIGSLGARVPGQN